MIVDPNLAVLTRADAKFGIAFLRQLALKGVKPSTLCVEYTPFAKRMRMAKFLARKIGWLDAVRYNTKFWLPLLKRNVSFGLWNPLPVFEGLAEKVILCRDINDESVVKALSEKEITKVVLAQSGIIRKTILDLNKWVLNSHPGKLPDFRGVDVVRWALLERQPIEVTLHLVEAGIDTGPILKMVPVPVLPGDSWESIEKRALGKSLEVLVDAAISQPAGYGEYLRQDISQGKQYYLMPFKCVRKLEKEWSDILSFYTFKKEQDD